MQASFWLERWQEGQIGFHQDQINDYLVNNWGRLNAPQSGRVLVPLCGKSKDMLWLVQQGHDVIGVELSSLAVDAFFAENQIEHEKVEEGEFSVSRSGKYELLCGDFFKLTAMHLEGVRHVYDRASLIALPPEMREKYAAHLSSLLPEGSGVLLVTMEYPQKEMDGPPFSVSEEEVHQLYDQNFNIERVEEKDILAANPRFAERGLSALVEKTYLMTRK